MKTNFKDLKYKLVNANKLKLIKLKLAIVQCYYSKFIFIHLKSVPPPRAKSLY